MTNEDDVQRAPGAGNDPESDAERLGLRIPESDGGPSGLGEIGYWMGDIPKGTINLSGLVANVTGDLDTDQMIQDTRKRTGKN